MSVWRYTAVPLIGHGRPQMGELAGTNAAEVRASLRRIGLQAIELKPASRPASVRWGSWASPIARILQRQSRSRRGSRKGEIYDSLATMLDAGVSLMEGVDTIARGAGSRSRSLRGLLIEIREDLRAGAMLSESMGGRESWFDSAEVAMVAAGERSGSLPDVMRSLAQRQTRSGELVSKLTGALAYPAVVAIVGLGVVVFLSTKTLPDLVSILSSADVPTPRLTRVVMTTGQYLARYGVWLPVAIVLGVPGLLFVSARWRNQRRSAVAWPRRLHPRLIRQVVVAQAMLGLAELVRTGVPIVEALRTQAPTVHGPGNASLSHRLTGAANEIERGLSLSESLNDAHWFDPELIRLIEIGETSGELADVLQRVAERQERSARATIERLAAMLEPVAILLLAVFVGVVVLAAILPLVRLQEVI